MEHVGADADRLQLKIENVKVFHYSGKVRFFRENRKMRFKIKDYAKVMEKGVDFILHEFFFVRDHVIHAPPNVNNYMVSILVLHWKQELKVTLSALTVKVKPWDFYFGTTKSKFSDFVEETLLPAYCGEKCEEDMQRKIRFAAKKWYESCEVDHWG